MRAARGARRDDILPYANRVLAKARTAATTGTAIVDAANTPDSLR